MPNFTPRYHSNGNVVCHSEHISSRWRCIRSWTVLVLETPDWRQVARGQVNDWILCFIDAGNATASSTQEDCRWSSVARMRPSVVVLRRAREFCSSSSAGLPRPVASCRSVDLGGPRSSFPSRPQRERPAASRLLRGASGHCSPARPSVACAVLVSEHVSVRACVRACSAGWNPWRQTEPADGDCQLP